MLLTGPPDMIEAALATIWPQLDPPVCEWSSLAELPARGRTMTVLIRNADTLSHEQQHIVLAWLDGLEPHQIQVVTTAPVDLFPLVQRGVFLERLYYRLNVLRLDALTLSGGAV